MNIRKFIIPLLRAQLRLGYSVSYIINVYLTLSDAQGLIDLYNAACLLVPSASMALLPLRST